MAADSSRRIVMLGAPGSGKGTQAARVAEEVGIPAISTGEMLRSAVSAGSALGKRVEAVMAAGELVSDDLMAELVRDRLARDDAEGGFVLDGYPRTAPQADVLDKILDDAGTPLDHVLFLDVPEPELVQRALARQRADDTQEVIQERLRVYREKTEPLIGRYESRGLLRRIDGHRPVDEILEDLLALVR